MAGMAMFTVHNSKTNRHITYKVKNAKNTRAKHVFIKGPYGDTTYWVYIGTIRNDGKFVWSQTNSRITEDDYRFKAFAWLYWKLRTRQELPESVSIKHLGMCGRCGAKLTHPKSIDSGYGPECVKVINTER
jgi:hypothetical protein